MDKATNDEKNELKSMEGKMKAEEKALEGKVAKDLQAGKNMVKEAGKENKNEECPLHGTCNHSPNRPQK